MTVAFVRLQSGHFCSSGVAWRHIFLANVRAVECLDLQCFNVDIVKHHSLQYTNQLCLYSEGEGLHIDSQSLILRRISSPSHYRRPTFATELDDISFVRCTNDSFNLG